MARGEAAVAREQASAAREEAFRCDSAAQVLRQQLAETVAQSQTQLTERDRALTTLRLRLAEEQSRARREASELQSRVNLLQDELQRMRDRSNIAAVPPPDAALLLGQLRLALPSHDIRGSSPRVGSDCARDDSPRPDADDIEARLAKLAERTRMQSQYLLHIISMPDLSAASLETVGVLGLLCLFYSLSPC